MVSRWHRPPGTDPAAIVTDHARPVHIERVGADVYTLRIGDTTLALSWVELAALRYELNEVLDG